VEFVTLQHKGMTTLNITAAVPVHFMFVDDVSVQSVRLFRISAIADPSIHINESVNSDHNHVAKNTNCEYSSICDQPISKSQVCKFAIM